MDALDIIEDFGLILIDIDGRFSIAYMTIEHLEASCAMFFEHEEFHLLDRYGVDVRNVTRIDMDVENVPYEIAGLYWYDSDEGVAWRQE